MRRLLGVLAMVSFGAQGAELCFKPDVTKGSRVDPADRAIYMEADEVEVKDKRWFHLRGAVDLSQANRTIHADSLEYTQPDGRGVAVGHVEITQPGLALEGARAQFETASERANVSEARYRLLDRPGHGSAGELRVLDRDTVELRNTVYSTCPEGQETWQFKARRLVLDKGNNNGDAYGVTMRFFDVPIVYLPYINFPLGERKSGILAPIYGTSLRRGREFAIPFYWNLAPNYDLTLTPHYMSKRGTQLQAEFRYLTARNNGRINAEYLDRDLGTGESRMMFRVRHDGELSKNWSTMLDYRAVTDQDYVRDMGGTVAHTSTSVLDRRLEFSRYGNTLGMRVRFQDFQPLAYTLTGKAPLYRREPQLLVHDVIHLGGGVSAAVEAELVHFGRAEGLTASRLDLLPQLRYRVDSGWGFIEPRLAWRDTRYWLTEQDPSMPNFTARTLPIASIDSGMVMERRYRGGDWVHTIEPRLYYLRVPYRDQTGLARARDGSQQVFDTGLAELSYEQQFNTNRFVGADRQADADQFNWGMQTRLINGTSGRETVTAAVAQTVYLAGSRVTLPGQAPTASGVSDLIGSLGFALDAWRLDTTGQWRARQEKPTAAHIRLSYRADRRNFLAALNYRENLVKQVELAGGWPVGDHWRLTGHVIHSLYNHVTLQAAAGIEYGNCCWGARLLARRYTNGITGDTTSMIGVQLEFKGLASVGSDMSEMSGMN